MESPSQVGNRNISFTLTQWSTHKKYFICHISLSLMPFFSFINDGDIGVVFCFIEKILTCKSGSAFQLIYQNFGMGFWFYQFNDFIAFGQLHHGCGISNIIRYDFIDLIGKNVKINFANYWVKCNLLKFWVTNSIGNSNILILQTQHFHNNQVNKLLLVLI